ncbi:MAG: hypothetical protein QM503_12860 [Bacteroidota bacterium]
MNNFTQNIIDHSIEYAKDLLTDTGQCYPFGATIDNAGIVHPLEFEIEDKKNVPNNETVIKGLRKYCETALAANSIKAYGIIYEASVQLDADADAIDTIAMDIVESRGEIIPFYYFPYTITNSDTVAFSETFAVKR